MSNYVKKLEDCANDEIGTKVANLKLVKEKTDLKIPPTIVLTKSAYLRVLGYNKIKDPFSFAWDTIKVPEDLEKDIFNQIGANFGDNSLVVRSSASCEDSPLLSFAGQYSSFLNIKGKEKILDAIKLCYGSLFSNKAVMYAKSSKVDLSKEYMAIAIQKVISITDSGVMFTANPITGDRDEIIIEYGKGLGDKIVGGQVVPEVKKLRKESIETIQPNFIPQVAKAGLNIEKAFLEPQDVEWGVLNNEVYIFQSRPITTLTQKTAELEMTKNLLKITEGETVCKGVVSGKLRIIKSEKDYVEIQPGDILLVLCKLDIKIIEQINKVSGMLITGGILSHFAVVAREFFKPTITKVKKFDYNQYFGKEVILDANKGMLYFKK